ncbi:MAG: ABC transporter permease [Actinobacteria bacterium]|nr:ABC transporter permease [Actinomycetota bacterium]
MTALIMSELRQRMRGKRWWILLGIWFAVLLGLIVLIRQALVSTSPDHDLEVGVVMFASLALLVLALACLVVPALTATSINGERDRGTLAILQATALRPWEIVAAKFIAALVTTAAFLAATIPIALWAIAEGGVSLGKAAAVYLTLFGVSAVLLAGAMGASAIVRRPALSAVLAYGFVFFLTIGTLILYGITMTTVDYDFDGSPPDYGVRWLVLAPNPFVVLADAAPASPDDQDDDPLAGMRYSIRQARDPQSYQIQSFDPQTGEPIFEEEPEPPPPVWPYGLAIEAGFAAFAFYVATQRLGVPAKKLPRGERIA